MESSLTELRSHRYTFSDLLCAVEDWGAYVCMQRVLNDLSRARLSRRRVIRLFPHPVSRQKARPATQGGEGVGESQIIWWREGLVLYKSFNTLRIYLMLCLLH
jgi:hypothetical protein